MGSESKTTKRSSATKAARAPVKGAIAVATKAAAAPATTKPRTTKGGATKGGATKTGATKGGTTRARTPKPTGVARSGDVAAFETKRGAPLPERLRRFFGDGEAAKYDGLFADPPSYASRLRVRFLPLGSKAAAERTSTKHAAWIPLCAIGSEESQFVAVDTRSADCPVAMWSHESDTMLAYEPTLDDFLFSLTEAKDAPAKVSPTKKKSNRDVLRERYPQAKKLRDKGKLDAALALLEPALFEGLPPLKTLTFAPDPHVGRWAEELRGEILRALGRHEEARATFEHCLAANASCESELALMELDVFTFDRARDAFDRHVAIEAAADARHAELSIDGKPRRIHFDDDYRRRLRVVGCAALRLGEVAVAEAQYRKLLEGRDYWNAKNPKAYSGWKDSHVAEARAELEAFAKQHDLDAAAIMGWLK